MIPPSGPRRRTPKYFPLQTRITHNLTKPLLLQLPLELRHQIYGYLFTSSLPTTSWIVLPHSSRTPKYRPFHLPPTAAALILTCWLLTVEVRAWLVQRLHFHYRQPEKYPVRDVAADMPAFLTANLRLLSIGIVRKKKRKVTFSLALLRRLFPQLEVLFLASRYVGAALMYYACSNRKPNHNSLLNANTKPSAHLKPSDADVVSHVFSDESGKGLRQFGIRYDFEQVNAFPDLKVFVKLKGKVVRETDACWSCHKRVYMAYMVFLNSRTVFRYYDHRLENRMAQNILMGKRKEERLKSEHLRPCDCGETSNAAYDSSKD